MMTRTFLCLLLGSALAVPAELPVTQVVLFKHGVGFFERSGALGPGDSARLDFDASEMNDVLKSLTIEERGGGKISGIRYDSMDPLSHTLAQFPFRIGGSQPLSAMLDQLKGARLELKFGNETVSGLVVNARQLDVQPEREQLTLMLDSGDLHTVDLSAASSIRFPDPKLQQQFKDYLSALAAARSKERRSVYIDCTDAKERKLTASYMIPAPVWKSSYRLILGAEAKPILEGWAIVDNTTGDDWTSVRLSLVSGRPISFISQLYPPRYLARQTVELPEDAAAQPVLHAGAYEEQNAVGRGYGGGIGSGSAGGVIGGIASANAPAPPPPPPPRPQMASPRDLKAAKQFDKEWQAGDVASLVNSPSSIVAGASADAVGELFEYRIAQPVTIRKNESAMLPFLQDAIDARKLLIWSAGASEHPTNAVEMTNSTGKVLDGGPVTVYDGGTYGGEALMETLKAGDKRLVSYAVDLGTRVTTAFKSKQAVVREMHLSRGVLSVKSAAEETTTYTARNVDQKPKTLIVEHPLRSSYTLLNQKPMEKTAASYRFEVPLSAGATREFAVNEEHVIDSAFVISNESSDFLLAYVRNRDLNEDARKQLGRIAEKKQQIADTLSAIEDARHQAEELNGDEDRLRRNIDSLNRVTGQHDQVQSYSQQLGVIETKISAVRDRQADLQKKKAALQHDLDDLVATLSF